MPDKFLPQQINSGPWVTSYSLNRLRDLPNSTEFVLPICSLGTTAEECIEQCSGPDRLVLPPLYREALSGSLQQRLVARILECFPEFGQDNSNRVYVIEFPENPLPQRESPELFAFSVDTAVEEHGPHLPLATDTIQSYSVLRKLQEQHSQIELGRPVDYGQLTWGLPFGFSVDITAELLTEYVCGYCNAINDWLKPRSMYVVDVHGSIVHREAIVRGIAASRAERWLFRWLHEPLAEFASQRGDQHAGGVETVLVEHVSPGLVDADWWPGRINELAEFQMTFDKAVELTPNLSKFCSYVDQHKPNGIIGDVTNARRLDADLLFERMLKVAEQDVSLLLSEESIQSQDAGKKLW